MRPGCRTRVLDGEAGDSQLVIVPVTIAKGLEFDHVIVVEPSRIAAAEARGLQRLYVALTRAVSRLTVLHTEPLPDSAAKWLRPLLRYITAGAELPGEWPGLGVPNASPYWR